MESSKPAEAAVEIASPEGFTMPLQLPRVFDNSTIETWYRCPRKGFYQYAANRAPVGINYPIQWGVAYHKFREVLEKLYKDVIEGTDLEITDVDAQTIIFNGAWNKALQVGDGWQEPPTEHRHSYLTKNRLRLACDESFENWLSEKRDGKIIVLFPECPFDLGLPNGELYGGRFDQLVEWNNKLWVRDFKTTSRMGAKYGENFDPNNQMTGYVWAAQKLSGRRVEGVIIEVVYNTKTKGPDFFPFLSTRTAEQIRQWEANVQYEISAIRRQVAEGIYPIRSAACNDYGGCFFRDACRRDGWRSIQNWLESNTTFSVWDFMDPDSETGVTD